MASQNPDLARREAALAKRAAQLAKLELQVRARETELSARRAAWGVVWRMAFAPVRVIQLLLGVWLAVAATAFGGTVLVVSAIGCGLGFAATALRELSLPNGVPVPAQRRRGLRARLAWATRPPARRAASRSGG